MSLPNRPARVATALALACCLTFAGQDSVAQVATEPLTAAMVAEIKQYVRELDSEDFALRERASQRLRQMDERVLPFLDEAAQSNSPEVRMRAGSLIRLMRVDPLEAY